MLNKLVSANRKKIGLNILGAALLTALPITVQAAEYVRNQFDPQNQESWLTEWRMLPNGSIFVNTITGRKNGTEETNDHVGLIISETPDARAFYMEISNKDMSPCPKEEGLDSKKPIYKLATFNETTVRFRYMCATKAGRADNFRIILFPVTVKGANYILDQFEIDPEGIVRFTYKDEHIELENIGLWSAGFKEQWVKFKSIL